MSDAAAYQCRKCMGVLVWKKITVVYPTGCQQVDKLWCDHCRAFKNKSGAL